MAQREFRGLWVATYQNLDWPSRPGLDAARQKAELIAIIDRAATLHLNAIVFQVRPCCDAFYDSKIEPWSAFLTGKMGAAPRPFFDPLAVAVAECHKRGLELHAWFNPFRVRSRDDKTPVAANFVSKSHPELVRTAGGFLWLDPSEPGTRDYCREVILDVVRRYDIDGVHIDDYFYPYPTKDYKAADFPDAGAVEAVSAGGRKAGARQLAARPHQLLRPTDLHLHQKGKAVGQIWDQPLWHLAARLSRRHRGGAGSVRGALRRLAALAGKRMGGLFFSATLLAGRNKKNTVSPRCCNGGAARTPAIGICGPA